MALTLPGRIYSAVMTDAPAPTGPVYAPGQVVTVFRSRLRPDGQDDYFEHAAAMAALARTMPGLVDFKSFTAEDGERVTLVTFADEGTQQAWRRHTDHLVAQRAGRASYYAEYSIQVCTTDRVNTFGRPGPAEA
jgi:heme-degrading monooxygenase HmoA